METSFPTPSIPICTKNVDCLSFSHFVLLQNERIQCAPCKTKGSKEEVEYIYDIYDAEDHKSSLVCDSVHYIYSQHVW